MSLVAPSQSIPVQYEARRLVITADLTSAQWESVGYAIQHMHDHSPWFLGDWWLYGERKWGEAAAQAAPTGYKAKTLQNAAFVCDRIPYERRRDTLSFGHHASVAALEPSVADALLDEAENEGYTVSQLRAEVRALKVSKATTNLERLANLMLVFKHDDLELYAKSFGDVAKLKVTPEVVGVLVLSTPTAEFAKAIEAAWVA